MNQSNKADIIVKGAKENNLKDIDLSIPHNKLIVVTGISGSGKSSLVFDVLAKEGQRRYFETLPSFARQFSGKLNRPNVDSIEGLSPVITIGQQTSGVNARSTVGTVSDIYDLLRLLFARIGETTRDFQPTRSLFSFNSDHGKCKRCNGIGKEEEIDLDKLIVHPNKTIREGALAPTLPTGYIMYSQVTIDVLNQVCQAEGFNVDIPWAQLTKEQKDVILYGSNKIKVPFGKHSLESRLKWTGIKAKPREEGFYKGMIPIMSDILRRDRNANILKYVHAVECANCNGARLNEDALSVLVHQKRIIDLSSMELNELNDWIDKNDWCEVGATIAKKITAQIELMADLGLGHLNLNRPASTLSSSEVQRIRVANQILVPLSDVLYIFDEPSIGLHPEENLRMIYHFKELVNRGNTVIVVEHDLETIKNADHIIEIGPEAGESGGEVLFSGDVNSFRLNKDLKNRSHTYDALMSQNIEFHPNNLTELESIELLGCTENNLKSIDVQFKLGGLNTVNGKSGSGKSSLVKGTLLKVIKAKLNGEGVNSNNIKEIKNSDAIDQLVYIDHSPIGRTPRSNPATYLGISDAIRDVYSKLDQAKEGGITKSMFSFNNKGGRCETCQGAGKTQIGMHFLGNVDLICESCGGKRFKDEVLNVEFNSNSIADVYQMTVSDALEFFKGYKKIELGLKVLEEIGLGYLRLGQSSTTLSGGEAQRIKIANQLQRKDTGNTLYVIIEPTIGLHYSNIQSLLKMFDRIKKNGNTIVCIEQDLTVIEASDWHIELGPNCGVNGGELVYQGAPEIKKDVNNKIEPSLSIVDNGWIELSGITTNQLKNINVRFPKNKISVVTGLSGSGKSSLVYDTLFSEANTRFTESLSTYNRSFIQQNNNAKIKSSSGLGPAIGLNRKASNFSSRSTVGTLTGIYDSIRLLYSRISQHQTQSFTAQDFSFNHHLGACSNCKGEGIILECNPNSIIIDHSKSILSGGLSTSKGVKYFTNPDGQFLATLKQVAKVNLWNLNTIWSDLDKEIQDVVLYGTGDKEWDVKWEFKTKSRSGVQHIKSKWLGFCNYINDEFDRKKYNKNINELKALLHEVQCQSCNGSRLKPELLKTKFKGLSIFEFTSLTLVELKAILSKNEDFEDSVVRVIAEHITPSIEKTLDTLLDLGLGYLNLNRSVKTLSGGEQQRASLASQLSNHLYGVTYVLDEPTIGLDKKQINTVVEILKKLNKLGNTVIVVEHDKSFVEQADYLVELGPRSGKEGGEVIYQGDLKALDASSNTLTYALLNTKQFKKAETRNSNGKVFGIKGARSNNLKGIDVAFNSNQITAISGVSGSGKSSLIRDSFYQSWLMKRSIHCDSLYGLDQFEEVIYINQNSLVSSQLNTPISYLGILDNLKATFASNEKAKELGFKKADFSYQSKNGKCTTCSGNGKLKTSMDFMSDIWLECYSCKGNRFNTAINGIKVKGLGIGDLMQLTINELLSLSLNERLNQELEILNELGIGHLLLGQSMSTLSGGEIQRLKLSKEIIKKQTGTCLYIFDEPSTGLHSLDLIKLIDVFNGMISKGHTIIFIEHNEELLHAANSVVKLGPGSGVDGGRLI